MQVKNAMQTVMVELLARLCRATGDDPHHTIDDVMDAVSDVDTMFLNEADMKELDSVLELTVKDVQEMGL